MLKNISESLEKEDYSTEVFTNLQDDEFKKCMENVLENLRTSSSDFLKKKIAQKVQKEILGLSSLINRESKSTSEDNIKEAIDNTIMKKPFSKFVLTTIMEGCKGFRFLI